MDQSMANVKGNHVEKPEKFKGKDFKRWQQKMSFYLRALRVSHVLNSEPPQPEGGDVPTEEEQAANEKAIKLWADDEFLCKNYILNTLDDSLYDIYAKFKTAKEIWLSLDNKYMTEVACSKKFVVGKFLNFRMTDNKSVVKQVEDLQYIIHELDDEGMGLPETFIVGACIEKLPPSWKDFKTHLKHLTEDMNFEQLVLKFRVEEDSRINEKADMAGDVTANVVESKVNFKKRKGSGNGAQKFVSKKPRIRATANCWVCGKPGHKAKDCYHKKNDQGGNVKNTNQANLTEKQFVAVVEANLVTNATDWWIDTGATMHVCSVKEMFYTYQPIEDGETLYMGNAATAKIEGKGNVVLKLTSGKKLMLSNVYHVPSIRKNLVSGPVLSNKGFKLVFESDKFVITKGGMFVGKGYLTEGLFKLNINIFMSQKDGPWALGPWAPGLL